MTDFKGMIVPLVTPFKGGEIDYDALKRVIENCIDGGADGFVCLGTTAETPTLTDFERDGVLAFTLENCKGKPVYAGTGSNCTDTAIKRTLRAYAFGANGVLSVCPYYNKPTKTGIIAHFCKISDASPLPIILYDVPSRTGVEMTFETVLKLKERANVVGIKLACDEHKTRAFTPLLDEGFSLFGGSDGIMDVAMKCRFTGMISAVANVMPITVKNIMEAYCSKQPDADEIFKSAKDGIDALYVETNPIAIKYALYKMGLTENELRLPMCPISHKNAIKIEKYIKQYC